MPFWPLIAVSIKVCCNWMDGSIGELVFLDIES